MPRRVTQHTHMDECSALVSPGILLIVADYTPRSRTLIGLTKPRPDAIPLLIRHDSRCRLQINVFRCVGSASFLPSPVDTPRTHKPGVRQRTLPPRLGSGLGI